jgi:hypothetical protein
MSAKPAIVRVFYPGADIPSSLFVMNSGRRPIRRLSRTGLHYSSIYISQRAEIDGVAMPRVN